MVLHTMYFYLKFNFVGHGPSVPSCGRSQSAGGTVVFKLMLGGNSARFAPAADTILHRSPSTI